MRNVMYWIVVVGLINVLVCPIDIMAIEVKKSEIAIGEKLRFHSKVLNEPRQIRVYAPNTATKNQKYQVIYLLDAEYLFTSAVGIVDALVASGKVPPSIIVGIDTTVRVRDYLPPIVGEPKSRQQNWIKKKFPQFGGTAPFTEFLKTELFPYVENTYSVVPTRTLVGYSNGGVFGLHTLVNSPELFTNYLLISPAAWWGEQEIDQSLARFSQTHQAIAGNLYMSVANEGRGMYSNAMRIASNLEAVAPSALRWQFSHFDDESHQSTVYPSIYEGLRELFSDLKFEVLDLHGKFATVDDIKSYYLTLSQRYEYNVLVPQAVFSDLADQQFLNNRNKEALATLMQFAQTYSDSSFAHSDLGRGYMRTNQFKLAKRSFEKAIEIVRGSEVSDPAVLDFLKDMANAAAAKL